MKQFNHLTIKNFFLYWLPPILWMLIIFYFSSHPRFGITHKFLFDFIIFKTLHMMEYGILYLLYFRAFYKTTQLPLPKIFLYSFLLALFYAATDELHQLFVPTREGRIRDIIIDGVGIGISYWWIKSKIEIFKKVL